MTNRENTDDDSLLEYEPVFDRARAPILFTSNLNPAFLGDTFMGATAFLICSGPSLSKLDLLRLTERGILTCSVNNAGTQVRTNLWVSFDDPGNFSDVIWRDPGILKMIPYARLNMKIRTRNSANELVESDLSAADMPNTFGYRSNSEFYASRWLTEDTVNCGQTGKHEDELGIAGSRSVMMVAIKLLYYLGIRRVFLLGCDFRMKYGQQNYSFNQHRTRRSVRGNNRTYRALNARFQELMPHFEMAKFQVFNCTPKSGLSVFPFLDYEKAIAAARESMPKLVDTFGMYEKTNTTVETQIDEKNG